MRRHRQLCNLLLEGDSYFAGNNVDMKKINKNTNIKAYCHNDECKTKENGINAVIVYIFKKFKNSILRTTHHNNYDEYLLMWISDKLLNMHKKGKGKNIKQGRMDATTLNQAYEYYLKNHKVKLDYWTLFNIKQGLKEANIWYMSEFYKLLNKICKIITEYNNNSAKNKQLFKYPADCSFQYKTLYLNISECKPYLDLLNKLKGIYDDFSSAIKKKSPNSKLATKLKKITLENGVELKAVRGFKTYDFSGPQCKFPKKKPASSKKTESSGPQASNQPTGVGNQSSGAGGQGGSGSGTGGGPGSEQIDQGSSDGGTKDTTSVQSGVPDGQISNGSQGGVNTSQQGTSGGSGHGTGNQGASSHQGGDTGSGSNGESPGTDTENGGSEGGLVNKVSEAGNSGNGKDLSKGGGGSDKGGSGGSDNGQGVKDSETGGSGSGAGGSNDGKSNADNGSSNGGTGGGSNDQGSNSGGLNDQGSNSDESSDLWQPIFKFVFNGMDKFNKASKFVNENHQKFKDAKDKINNAYNDVKDNLKNVYDKSSNYFNEFINNITKKFNQVNIPSKPGNSGNNLPQNNDKLQKSGDLPHFPPKNTSQDSPSQLPSPPPSPSDSPKGPSPNTPQQKQPPSQSQPTTQQNPQDDPSNQKKTGKTNLKLVKLSSPDHNLKNTRNGSEDCKPEITFMNTTLACCTSKQCSITGVSVILVLIPIILLIVYKYLSREWTKKSEKKNMKKVIKLVDGKRKTKIIISSSDRNKDLKPIINSVNRKKDPLLNIYKLMQADPIPFINLFFLLIFFVYKRKENFLEL
ncbi:PIR protein CIR protein [Plasmodium vinckei brucechwatti]|uniref:PIR protein CIR protein n=1 Tax=Plasmodium vinckei brucechwatti TaxID=119398 RepID=A0A6V7S5L6_PLAVN|nr:PIR protein CIR protein [Plasmodium vinckei brucechwatti]